MKQPDDINECIRSVKVLLERMNQLRIENEQLKSMLITAHVKESNQKGTIEIKYQQKQERIIKSKEVANMLGISRSTLWRLEKQKDFPLRRRVGNTAAGWLESDVANWVKKRETY